jgi:CheY-like chemotaxis protein
MAADKIPHVFEKFFQADASTTRVFGGTGLGLPICKQLVELMGGEIHVESELGKGTTVSFEIEVPRSAASEEEARVNSLPKDIRALVVDDDEVARRVLSQLCISFGMKCDTAQSGMEALTKMRAAATQGVPYTLALLDMRMPLMDGAQLARTIKKDEQLKSTRLAIVSAFARPDDSTLPIGMVEAVLTKPVRADVLLPVLTRMFRTNQGATTTTSIKPRVDSGSGLLGGKRVLVVEDNAVNQKLVSRMLEKLGCKFDMAANGNEAVGMALNMHFDLVLMDCQMPELDGYDATREIRRRMGHQRLPIVAMTANAMQGDRDKCLAAGMDDYISKPMKLEDVRDTLTRWLIVAPGQATVARMTPRHVASN